MNKYKNNVLNRLKTELEDRIENAAREFLEKTLSKVGNGDGSYHHDTYNLYDSYGYAIFLDGKVIRSSTTERTATEPRKWYGNEYFGNEILNEAFKNGNYKPSVSTGYVVVFGALMPYGSVLERGGGNLKDKYRVILFMEDEARRFGELIGIKVLKYDVKLGKYEVK